MQDYRSFAPTSTSIRTLTVIAVITLLGLACTEAPTSPLQKPAFAFSSESVNELSISRSFPGEESWTVRLKRVASKPIAVGLGTRTRKFWMIDGAPAPLSDGYADGVFVEHLLSTLKTVHAISTPEKDLPERFGIPPGRARIEWADDKGQQLLTLGEEAEGGTRYGRSHVNGKTQIFGGAVLRMVETLKGWEGLRQHRLFFMDLDDIDVVEVSSGKRRTEYERVGIQWKKTFGKGPLLNTLPAQFERLFHFRVKRFIDAAELQNGQKAVLISEPLYTLTFKDRANLPTVFQFTPLGRPEGDGSTLFRSSDRGEVVMETYPEILDLLGELLGEKKSPAKITARN